MLKKIGYGLILWVIPYVTAIPLLGLMKSDLILFKTIMIVEGALVGAALTVLYFLTVNGDFMMEGITVATIWIAVNWLMDFVALLPFTDLSVTRYFLEIGLRYLAIVAPTAAVGYVLERRAGRLTS
jgi:uncharacterized membrane protein YpjA